MDSLKQSEIALELSKSQRERVVTILNRILPISFIVLVILMVLTLKAIKITLSVLGWILLFILIWLVWFVISRRLVHKRD
ncbi:hypothetical protein IC620_12035 [Hazenella sp. IB182357]|uniref:Uncharacterized protein n=1 Tax=Polycladospora coralii TaxID=2771432 RepID=A0A926NGU5_9BACL|nr:hypothetical protein [Polycladospora coralii]MBD1373083.1 hypothetical protein [Polycladospora coralii]MBS7529571.1 hypothetical protein [Polycladospora coralii]